MLKRLVNEAYFAITITTTGPLLIKSGRATILGPDMTPVLTIRNGEEQVYIPGSSLKGTFRSHVEKVIRTLRPDEIVVADTFKPEDEPDQACGHWFKQRERERDQPLDTTTIYRDSDPVARLFGSTSFIGRVSIGDAYLCHPETGEYLVNGNQAQRLPTEQRDGVGIDRMTGGAYPRAKFELEAVAAGTVFRSEVLLRNFECWQLGALLLVAQDMEDELVRLGSGKSRGLGAVRTTVDCIRVYHLGKTEQRQANQIWGLGRFLGSNTSYGTWADDVLKLDQAPAVIRQNIRQVQTFVEDHLAELKQTAVQEFVQRMDTFPAYKHPRGEQR